MFKKVAVFLIILGFAHGYFMSYSRNKDKVDSVYPILESNKSYLSARINEILESEGGAEEARDYLRKQEDELNINNQKFVDENPRYVLLRDRDGYE